MIYRALCNMQYNQSNNALLLLLLLFIYFTKYRQTKRDSNVYEIVFQSTLYMYI